jgi:hypothetical protein
MLVREKNPVPLGRCISGDPEADTASTPQGDIHEERYLNDAFFHESIIGGVFGGQEEASNS